MPFLVFLVLEVFRKNILKNGIVQNKEKMTKRRKKNKNFGKIYNFKLTTGETLIIPKEFAHGYSSLAKENIVIYFLSGLVRWSRVIT